MRRSLRRAVHAVVLVLCAAVVATMTAPTASADDAYDALRSRWAETLTGGSLYSTSDSAASARLTRLAQDAQGHWNSMNTGSGRTSLWNDLDDATTGNSGIEDTWYSYLRLRDMTLAYASNGSSLQGNTSLRAAIISALDWLHTNRYNTTITKLGNWWLWEVGVPLALNDVSVLLYAHLSSTQVSNYQAAIELLGVRPR